MARRMQLRSHRFGADARRSEGRVRAEGAITGASRLARLHPKASPQRHRVEHLVDLRYAEGTTIPEHLLDVWRPSNETNLTPRQGGPPWPVVFDVHAGSFRILSKDMHWIMALSFARLSSTRICDRARHLR